MKNAIALFALLLCMTAGLQAQKLSGKASYYADRFHGRPTSTGETYDKNAYTAASMEFPVGTVLRVTNVANNQVTQVRVNDCGPHHPDRFLDLSRAAAEQIGLLRAGVAVVNLEVLAMGTEGLACDRSKQTRVATKTTPVTPGVSPPVATPPSTYGATAKAQQPADPNASLPTGNDPIFYLYGVQIAAYGKTNNASEFMLKTGDEHGFLFKRTDAKLTRVFVGPFLTEEDAKAKVAELKSKKVNGIVRRVQ
ncbi:hypothetical protein CEQ90_17565 [Lewinellaceae bacterium SD302]|nr:hypothetical protein CEQ90_17565 [Lewinellaceae bacterium SD302]